MSTVTTQLNSGTTPIPVASGGTGIASATNFAPLCSGTTATGVWQPVTTGLPNASYYLTSNGASALPSFLSHNISFLTVPLTTGNVLSMGGTPIQILAAQGAHTLIVVYFAMIEYIFNTTGFTTGGQSVQLQYGNTGSNTAVIATGLDFSSSTSSLFYGSADQQAGFFGVGPTSPVSGVINQGIYITTSSGSNFTGGGSSTAVVTIYYDVLSTTV
jgi:hypothetical protein